MKTFFELKPKIWQHLYSIQQEHTHESVETQKHILTEALRSLNFTDDDAPKIASMFLESLTLPYSADDDPAFLSLLDIRQLKILLAEESDARICRLLVAFAVFARANPHHSHWIKYDKKTIFYLASLAKLSVSEQESLTRRLHSCYNLHMQVVGSTQPMACFQLTWQEEISSGQNPLVDIGPISPQTITDFTLTNIMEDLKDNDKR